MSIHLSPVLRKANDFTYLHYCPGCKEMHQIWVKPVRGPSWTFNEDVNKPSFSPSVKHTSHRGVCHYFITDGNIAFCGDSSHELSNKTVPLPAFPDIELDNDDSDEA